MKVLRVIILFGLFSSITVSLSFANDLFKNSEKFKEYNPDGKKFQFVRDYVSSLGYLYTNYQKDIVMRKTALETISAEKREQLLVENLSNQNVNIRVARNLLKRYQQSENGLILKVADLYIKACDGLILMNEKEKSLIKEFASKEKSVLPAEAVSSRFEREQYRLAFERKEASKKVLKASVLLSKTLVSNKTDKFGELLYLGITDQERKKLLKQINSYVGDKYKGKIRPGQSYLQASIAAIRQVLEDQTWTTISSMK